MLYLWNNFQLELLNLNGMSYHYETPISYCESLQKLQQLVLTLAILLHSDTAINNVNRT